MKDGVNSSHDGSEVQFVRMSSNLLNDFEGSHPDMVQFFRGSLRVDIFGVQVHLLADPPLWRFRPVAILVFFLRLRSLLNRISEILLKLLPFPSELFRGGDVDCIRTERDDGVSAIVGEEGRYTGSRIWRIVVDEFGDRQPVIPVVLFIVDVDPEVLFQGLIRPLGLTICFRVIRR